MAQLSRDCWSSSAGVLVGTEPYQDATFLCLELPPLDRDPKAHTQWRAASLSRHRPPLEEQRHSIPGSPDECSATFALAE